jgi:hypothetical protein
MPITQQEAAQALKDITRTERRSVSLQGYQMSWPHLVLWGIIWFVGYGAMAVHVTWPYLWPVLAVSGSAGSFIIGYLLSRGRQKGMDWRYFTTFLAIVFFIFALLSIIPPHSDAQYGAFFPILVSLYYALIGIWTRGMRMLVLAILLALSTLGAFFYLQQEFELVMAGVGGVGLVLGGLWLRGA